MELGMGVMVKLRFVCAVFALVVSACASTPPKPACTQEHTASMLLKTYEFMKIKDATVEQLTASIPEMQDMLAAHAAYDKKNYEGACTLLRKFAAEKNFDIE